MSYLIFRETATRGILWKKVFLEILQISQENTFMKKKNLAQVISCEFCEISKNTFFTEHLWKTGSVFNAKNFCLKKYIQLFWYHYCWLWTCFVWHPAGQFLGLLENRLTFFMKIKHCAFLLEIIFLQKIAT